MNKKVLHSVIDHVALERKQAIAIEENNRVINYTRLSAYSNCIGHNLVSLGVSRGEPIGVYLDSGIDYVSSLLGINKAGGIFMPLELSYPVMRMVYLLDNVQPKIIITNQDNLDHLLDLYKETKGDNWLSAVVLLSGGDGENIELLTLENNLVLSRLNGQWNEETLTVEVDGDDSNYILYTSGSTGNPKIIEGCHKSLSHFIHWEKGEFNFDSTIKVSQLAPISFDVSLRDIFLPLLSGGTLCVPHKDIKRDPIKLLNWIGNMGITAIHTVPSIFRLIIRSIKDDKSLLKNIQEVSHILLAGEALYGRDVIEWRMVAGRQTELVNLYGPTETTLAKLFYRINDEITDPGQIIPLGKPIANAVAIVISDNEICNTGIIGEIYIKTPFRSKGYYKDEEQTKSRFVQNPLHKDYEDIVYKTGDLGRYLEDGRVEFIGREDGQIKIRGNRVELLEVEKVIMSYEGIKQVIVLPIKRSEDEEILVCYFIEDNPVDIGLLRNYVANYLPDYMYPSFYVGMDEFPLNLNGKIDRRSLPRPEGLLYEKLGYEAPANPVEEKIAAIWSDILGLKKVGVLNSFYELGGHSLTATRVVSRIYQDLEQEISLKDFFDHSTVRSLASFLATKTKTTYKVIEPLGMQESYPVSHAQKRLWVTDQLYGTLPYHMLGGCYINMILDISIFGNVFQTIVSRHESLRTTFIEVDGEPRQVVNANSDFELEYFDLTADVQKEQRASELIRSEQTTPFDLTKGPLLRSKLIQLESDKYLFLFNIHHIISDGWSRAVLVKEILVLYDSYRSGKDNPLKPLRIHYKDYASWQNKLVLGAAKDYKGYWHKKLGGNIPSINLPTDYKRQDIKSNEGNKYSFELDASLSSNIRKLCIANDASLFMYFQSIINIELSHLSGQKDILIGSAIAGRNHPELENQIGFYLNNLVLRNEVDPTLTFTEFLTRVRQSTLEAYEYQEYPYDRLVEELEPDVDQGRNPFYDVLLVMNNEGLNEDKYEGKQLEEMLGVSHLPMEESTSKLDLSFFINDEPQISITIEYSTELFKESSITKMEDELVQIINMSLDKNQINIGEMIWALSGVDKTELLGTMNEINDSF